MDGERDGWREGGRDGERDGWREEGVDVSIDTLLEEKKMAKKLWEDLQGGLHLTHVPRGR